MSKDIVSCENIVCNSGISIEECKTKLCETPSGNAANYRPGQGKCCVKQCTETDAAGLDGLSVWIPLLLRLDTM